MSEELMRSIYTTKQSIFIASVLAFVFVLVFTGVNLFLAVRSPVSAAGETLTISAPVVFSSGYTISSAQFIDSANSAYFFDPAATGTSMAVAGNVGIGTTSPRGPLHVYETVANGYSYVQTSVGSGGTVFSGSDTIPITSGNGVTGYGGLALIPNRWGNATTVDQHNLLYLGGAQRNSSAIASSMAFANWGYFTGTGAGAGGLGNATAQGDAAKFRIELKDLGAEFSQRLDFISRSASATDVNALTVLSSGNVGIGSTAPGAKLEVAGNINSSTGALQTAGVTRIDNSGVGTLAAGTTIGGTAVAAETAGQIAFFATACPTGWTEYTALRGRAIIGTPLSGTNAGTVGTAFTNLEDRTHTHTGPSHTHTVSGYSATTANWAESCCDGTVQNTTYTASSGTTTSASGTGATGATSATMPYIQLTACQKS